MKLYLFFSSKKAHKFYAFLVLFTCSTFFAQAGKDGNLTLSTSNTVLNRYAKPAANIAAGATSFSVSNIADLNRDGSTYLTGFVSNAASYSSNALSTGDLIMIYQVQGAIINTTNTIDYGAITSYNGAGNYEYARVVSVAGNTINLSCAVTNSYAIANHVQVVRVPQYNTLTVTATGSIVTVPWGSANFGGANAAAVERRRGGINTILSNNLVNNGTINADSAGFRGGETDNNTSGANANFYTDFVTTSSNISAEKGESIAGYSSEYDALGGRYGRGAPANGGGGGNAHNASGGGGANGGIAANWFRGAGVMNSFGTCGIPGAWALDPDYIANANALTNSAGGGRGGYSYSSVNADACLIGPSYPANFIAPGIPAVNVVQDAWGADRRDVAGGLGGRPLTTSGIQKQLFFGGGGGAGDGNNNAHQRAANGGGIVLVMNLNKISGTGTFTANGEAALNTVGAGNDAPGGGGGGGTVLIQTIEIVNAAVVRANGGKGGDQLINSNEAESPGGGGGGGVVAIINATVDASIKNSTGGLNGLSTSFSVTEFPANGATSGGNGTISSTSKNVTICGACYKPALKDGNLYPTQHGITALARAGADNGNWPMVRQSGWTAMEAKTKGFVVNRIQTTAQVIAIPNPVEGMMVFDIQADCLKINTTGTSAGWKCLSNQTCP
ncbi:hypothetical protein [Frigoriflavimonas asaccharolytica]|uniref:Uncharacterized protein n=1 Tax=Frigoriflavimonas asaccharolytica TaxID=2735899 RepID=A0A8J8K9K8_9FLAO|nr:hypothetical protein [Frigoriflavimonas asaccharolytica]NRS93167.1 hypothetical protein [Frigoriflavimonas asaccharolytica]